MANGKTDWQKLEQLFDEAVSLPSKQRGALLQSVKSSDPKLHGELLSLLNSHDKVSKLDSSDSLDSGIALALREVVDRVQRETLSQVDRPVQFELIQRQLETDQPDFRVDGVINRGATGLCFGCIKNPSSVTWP